ncbi:hypothetical protein [Rubidibacter lacunae]|nr:hypothetical protein [Rubidibacter lacunae]
MQCGRVEWQRTRLASLVLGRRDRAPASGDRKRGMGFWFDEADG